MSESRERLSTDRPPVADISGITIVVANEAEADQVLAAFADVSDPAQIEIASSAMSLPKGPTLVVGELADSLDLTTLTARGRDFLPHPFTPQQLLLRAQILAQRHAPQTQESSKDLREYKAKMDDLEIIVRSVADAVKVAVMFYDTDNHPIFRNRMVEEVLELTGYDPKTGTSTHVYASDRHTPVKRDKDIVSETIEGDQRGVIYWVGAPDRDDQRAVITEAHRVTRPGGEPLGSAIVTYDVTDLANAIEVREGYLATMSHELRTPLTSIVGYLDLIADTHDVAELGFEREFRIIQRNVNQMLNLLRDLASSGTREQSLRIEPVDLAALVSQSIEASRPSIDQAGQSIELKVPPSSLIGRVDAARIAQVLDNFVSNAVKYTPAGGTITVTLTREDEDAVIRIADTGRGMSKNDQARAFERFFRSHEVRDAAIPGVGIGLSIAKTITEAHGGTITIDSEPGKGATFITRLPLRPQGAPLSSLSDHP